MSRRDGKATRERIMDTAESLILRFGYTGTTVDKLIAEAGITKGAFFYHFKAKDDLGRALIERFKERDAETFSKTRSRAEKLSDDPLQQVLIFIGLFKEMFEGLEQPYPGCLFASYVYELQQFDDETKQVISDAFRSWRVLLMEKFEAAIAVHPPKLPVDTSSLADMFTVMLEGAFITGKALDEAELVSQQLQHFRNYVMLLFSRN